MDNVAEALAQIQEEYDARELLEENFADTAALFGKSEFIEWLFDDETFDDFSDCFDGAIDFCAFNDFFDDAVAEGSIYTDNASVLVKQYVRETAKIYLGEAFGRMCARYDVPTPVSVEESVETLGKLQSDRRTGKLGATLLFWFLFDKLDGDTAADKIGTLEHMGVRL